MTSSDHQPTAESSTDQDTEPALSKDVVFEILKNQRRRRVLQYLRDNAETELGTLAEAIAAAENETTVEELSADERKRVYIGLYQTHLPKMDDAGVVTYDQDRGTVSAGPEIEQLYPYLEADGGSETPDTTTGSDFGIDVSTLTDDVTLPGWALFGVLLVVGLLTAAATAFPDPAWAAVLVVVAALTTWAIRWE